MYWRWRDLKLR